MTDGWSAPQTDRGAALHPRLRLLYHVDLKRIGAHTVLGAISDFGERHVIGRRDPVFASARGGEAPRALEDPMSSRAQFTVAWRAKDQVFEVEPCPDAKSPLSVVATDAEEAWPRPVRRAIRLPPGSCLAVGDRALIALELVSRADVADRMGFVGESEALWRLRETIRAVACFDGPALVTGPTGAGKELVARAIHAQSERAAGPFVPVNCAALPERLVESLLFGHRKGAFTGADTSEPGLFLSASGGTLFLDELGELPLAIQPKLLRVLQDGVITPVGSHATRATNARLIAATNRDLASEVAAGRLREDLFHRVAGHTLPVPPLSARRFDVPELFVYLLDRLTQRHPQLEWLWAGRSQWRPTVPIRFFADLLRRRWPGNVRELEHYVERVARQCRQAGTFEAPDEAPVSVALPGSPPPTPDASPTLLPRASELLGLAHKTLTKLLPMGALRALHEAAREEGWSDVQHREGLRGAVAEALYELLWAQDFNRSRAAQRAEMSRTTFGKLLRDFGLRRAAELSPEELLAVRARARRDLLGAARDLRVSPEGLRRQLGLLDQRGSGVE